MKYLSHVGIGVVLAGVLVACGTSARQPAAAVPASNAAVAQSEALYVTKNTLAELTEAAPLVIIGTPQQTEKIVNMARNVDDVLKEDPSIQVIGQVYEIQVQETLKGPAATTIYLVQAEGMLDDRTAKTPAEQAKARAKSDHLTPDRAAPYVFFLEPLRGFAEGYYVQVAHPGRFKVTQGRVAPETPWQEAQRLFPPQDLEDLKAQVKKQP